MTRITGYCILRIDGFIFKLCNRSNPNEVVVDLNRYRIGYYVCINLRTYLLVSFKGTGVTQAEKYQIMEAHNRLRSSVAQGQVPNQPGAQNMQEMVWDDELAAKAQQWANQCTFEHDPSRYLGE